MLSRIILVSIILFSACVPMKKLVYLQEDDSQIEKKAPTEYYFKPNDLIFIRIKTRDEKLNELFNIQSTTNNVSPSNLYFVSYQVDKEGMVELPVIGKIKAAGKNSEQLQAEIKEILLSGYFKYPQDVFVNVKPAGIMVTVIGEVNSPGTLTLLKPNPSILEAVAEAGDITLTGNRTDIMVIRQKEDGTTLLGNIDLTQKDALNSPYFYLKNNDVVYVKPLPQKTVGTGTTFVNTLTTVMGVTSFLISLYLISKR